MRYANFDWYILLTIAAGLAVVASALVFRWVRRPQDPDDAERRRRARLSQIGRIAEGQVLEIVEVPASPAQAHSFTLLRRSKPALLAPSDFRKLVCYNYRISGVSYETAQDITGLEERAELQRIAIGQPASVKYDPVNPTNSILVADDWSGLH